ncbi:MAG: hypothetical protein F4Z72_10400 [Gemmatimonadales bacterium]|nr:hypothetical protein [Candidatus Palauibacter irciniicola]
MTMPQLAFFPWIDLEDDVEIGSYSLKRYMRESLPAVNEECRTTLDSVLAPYRDAWDDPVGSAVMLNRKGRGLTDDLSGEDRDDLFRFAELFSFVALAVREFFVRDYYYNRENLRLVIQAFADPQGGAVVNVRRRDGVVQSIIPGALYRVPAPDHVAFPGLTIKPDWALLDALLASRAHEAWSRLYQGIVLFNQANTDAPDVSMDTELVLTYAAMEQILGISSRSDRSRFHARFAEAWPPSREVPRSEWRAPPAGRTWAKDSLRACWAFDLERCRGSVAHGHHLGQLPSLWEVPQHLLLASFAIPRLVKQVLSGVGLYTLTGDDRRDLDAFELLLNLPDLTGPPGSAREHESRSTESVAWQRVLPYSRSLESVLAELR